jgi:hypothetical protein
MYQVTVANGSKATLQTSDGKQIPPGGSWKSEAGGDMYVTSVQGGTIRFTDIADTRIPGDTAQTWGVLISYQGEEVVGRYEGGGELTVQVNRYLQVALSGMAFRQVYLPAMTFSS